MEEYRLVYDLFMMSYLLVMPMAIVGWILECIRGAR